MARFSGRRLREARIASGLRPEQLAVAIGKSFHTIQSYELGRALPPADVLGALATVLDVTVDEMFEVEPAGSVA